MTETSAPPTPKIHAARWWYRLNWHRGDRAALRRAVEPIDIIVTRAFHDLCQRLGGEGHLNDGDIDRIAASSALIARLPASVVVREPDGRDADEPLTPFTVNRIQELFEYLGSPADEGARARPRLSRSRFLSLLRTNSDEAADLVRGFGAALALLPNEPKFVHPGVVLEMVTRWPFESVRRTAATSYWTAAIKHEPRETRK